MEGGTDGYEVTYVNILLNNETFACIPQHNCSDLSASAAYTYAAAAAASSARAAVGRKSWRSGGVTLRTEKAFQ